MAEPVLPPAAVSASPPDSAPEPDWTDQVTDLIVDVVDRVHDSTTGPLVKVAKSAVYGVVAGIVGTVAIVLGTIFAVRALGLIPGDIWIPYLVAGVLLAAVGLVLWSKRGPKEPT
jgi:hypothetical protein